MDFELHFLYEFSNSFPKFTPYFLIFPNKAKDPTHTFVQMFAPGCVGVDIRLRISHSNLVHRTEETVRNQFEVSMPKKYFSSLMVKNKLPGKYMFHIVNSLQNYYNTEQPQPNFVN